MTENVPFFFVASHDLRGIFLAKVRKSPRGLDEAGKSERTVIVLRQNRTALSK